jgi:long-subunit acyl-CoA synthetase (AMP-forming)
VLVPIPEPSSVADCARILARSRARLAFCENAAAAMKLDLLRDRCPDLLHVVLLDGVADGAISLRRLRRHAGDARLRELHDRMSAIGPEHPAVLRYIAADERPLVQTHDALVAMAQRYRAQLAISWAHTMFLVLPLSHAAARVPQIVALSAGARVCFGSGDAAKTLDRLAPFRGVLTVEPSAVSEQSATAPFTYYTDAARTRHLGAADVYLVITQEAVRT